MYKVRRLALTIILRQGMVKKKPTQKQYTTQHVSPGLITTYSILYTYSGHLWFICHLDCWRARTRCLALSTSSFPAGWRSWWWGLGCSPLSRTVAACSLAEQDNFVLCGSSSVGRVCGIEWLGTLRGKIWGQLILASKTVSQPEVDFITKDATADSCYLVKCSNSASSDSSPARQMEHSWIRAF